MTIFSHILQVENALTLHTNIEFEMPALPSFPSLGFLDKSRQKTPFLSRYGTKSDTTQKLPSLHYDLGHSGHC